MLAVDNRQQYSLYFDEFEFKQGIDDYIIRSAESTDFETIVEVVNAAYWSHQQNFFIDSPLSRKRINLTVLNLINTDPTQKLFVLFNKTKNVVSGIILFELPMGELFAKFGLFALDESCRGKNLGPQMISFVERCAVNNGRNKMKIEVFNFAHKLSEYYKTFGYAFTGVTATFFHKDCIQEKYRNENELYLQEMVKLLK